MGKLHAEGNLLSYELHTIVGELVVSALTQTCIIEAKLVALLVYPANDSSRIANHQGKSRDIFGDHSTSTDKSIFTNGGTTNYSGIGANGGTLFHQGF